MKINPDGSITFEKIDVLLVIGLLIFIGLPIVFMIKQALNGVPFF